MHVMRYLKDPGIIEILNAISASKFLVEVFLITISCPFGIFSVENSTVSHLIPYTEWYYPWFLHKAQDSFKCKEKRTK
jgi:hypothetical protein